MSQPPYLIVGVFRKRLHSDAWESIRTIEVSRCPCVGEFVSFDGEDGGLFRVTKVVHLHMTDGGPGGSELLLEEVEDKWGPEPT